MTTEHTDFEVRHLRELMETWRSEDRRALELQAREYERRLDDLNHAHVQALEDRANFVALGTYNANTREWEIWRRSVDNQLSSAAARSSVFAALGLAGFSLLGLVINIALSLAR